MKIETESSFKAIPRFSDILIFTGFWFYKDKVYNMDNFDNCFLEKSWDEVTSQSTLYEDSLRFEKDCFAMELETVIPSSRIVDRWGMQMMIDEIGFDDVFKDFQTKLINLGKEQLKKMNEPPKLKPKADFSDFEGLLLKQEPVEAVRIFTAWDFWISHDGEDSDWKLVGIIDPDKITVEEE